MSTSIFNSSMIFQNPAALLEFCAALFTALYVAKLAISNIQAEKGDSASQENLNQTSPLALAIPLREMGTETAHSLRSARLHRDTHFVSVGTLISLPKRSLRWQSIRCFRRTGNDWQTHRMLPAE